MRADRFGSYSIAATFAGTPSFRRLKSMIAVAALVAAALVARRDAAVVVAAALLRHRLEQALLRLVFVISSNVETDMKRRPGRRRLVPTDRHLELSPLEDLDRVAGLELRRWPSSSPGACP